MKAFFAIITLTFRNALRSHIFQMLAVLLLLCVTVIPISISVGKAEEFIRVSLLYSLWSVSIVLALSSLWLGCFVMSQDIDSYQLHMVVAKPVSRITVWLGKWVGINLINISLLLASGAAVYAVVMTRYHAAGSEMSLSERQSERTKAESEKERIKTKILAGRRSYFPSRPEPEKIAEAAVKNYADNAAKEGKKVSSKELEKLYNDLIAKYTNAPDEVLVGQNPLQTWVFTNVPQKLNQHEIFLRYRPYLGKVSSEDQRQTYLWWEVLFPLINKETQNYQLYPRGLTQGPEQIFSGAFIETALPPGSVTPDGEVIVRVANYDRYGAKHYYQQSDGPKLLVPVCSFEENYLRAMLVMSIQLLLLSGLSCAFGGFLTMPTAVFMVASYLLFGSFSMILTDSEFFVSSTMDKFSQILANILLTVVIPLQRFDITDLLSGGDLIEFSLIGKLFFEYFLLRGLPLFLFGIWMYRKRELGLVVRK